MDGTITICQPTLLLDLMPAPTGTMPPSSDGLPERDQLEGALVSQSLDPFLKEVASQREKEIVRIAEHIEISLDALINKQQLRLIEMQDLQQMGDTSQPWAANIKTTEDRLEDLNARRENRLRERRVFTTTFR